MSKHLRLSHEQRGFVLSGLTLLLVLPAMFIAASYFKIVEAGGEAASLQALADKVSYTGHDIERVIEHMENQKLIINGDTLNDLADNYSATTGLLVTVALMESDDDGENLIVIDVRDPRGATRYSATVRLSVGGED